MAAFSLLATFMIQGPTGALALIRGPSPILALAHGGCAKSASWYAASSLTVSSVCGAALVERTQSAMKVANIGALVFHSFVVYNFTLGPRRVAEGSFGAAMTHLALAAISAYGLWRTRESKVWSKRS